MKLFNPHEVDLKVQIQCEVDNGKVDNMDGAKNCIHVCLFRHLFISSYTN